MTARTVVVADEETLLRCSLVEALAREDELNVVSHADGIESLLTLITSGEVDLALVSSRLMTSDHFPQVTQHCATLVLLKEADGPNLVAALEAGALGGVSAGSTYPALLANVDAAMRGEACIPRTLLGDLLQQLIDRNRNAAETDRKVALLSKRERQVFELLGQGLEVDAIATELYVTQQTIRSHVQNLMTKLEVHNRLDVVTLANRVGAPSGNPSGGVSVD